MNEKQILKLKLLPVILTVVAIILDQLSKALVVKYIPLLYTGEDGAVINILGNFFRLIHVRNPAIAFSFGAGFSDNVRKVLFSVIPLIVIAVVFVVYFRNNEFTKLQRWSICGILGGGLGNIIDRIFRPAGVVDFLDFKWFGLGTKGFLSWDRWPTFNIADSFVVVCGALFLISILVAIVKDSKKAKEAKKNEDESK